MDRSIVLIGCMGSGKSTVAKYLAKQSSYEIIDTDRHIETSENRRITGIFNTDGETYFRQLENKLCHTLKNRKNCIISTGGGTILSRENQQAFKDGDSFIVYLYATPNELWNRIKHSRHRPLVQTENPEETLTKIVTDRHPIYTSAADYILNTQSMSPKKVAETIWTMYTVMS